MKRSIFIMLPAVLTLSAALVIAQAPEQRTVTAEQKRQATDELAKLLRGRYCIADQAEKAAKFIERRILEGTYDRFREAQAFAEAITVDLQNVTSDKHLRFGAVLPEPPPKPGTQSAAANADAERAARVAEARRNNYGLPQVEILPGNVGYLEVRRFQPPDLAGDTLVATMGFLANSDAIIVDVRNCRGGSAFAMPIFAGYFFLRPTHLFDMEFRGDNYTEHYWTAAWLPGKRLAEVPMYILTSAYTFSGAEGFAYRFKVLKRATIVGETTGGGANAGGVKDVAPFFRVWMPMGRPVDRDTGTNWEGTGVQPDIKTAARDALAVAHTAAIKALKAKATNETDRARMDWALERAEARHHPVKLSQQDLERLIGNYGRGRVWVEGNQLRFQRETEAPYLLVPVTRSVFASETNDPVRVQFFVGPDGRVKKLTFTDEDGRLVDLPPSR